MRVDTAARLLAAAGVRWVRFEVADLRGHARSKSVPLARFPLYGARGLEFAALGDGSQRDGEAFERDGRPTGDVLLIPDLDTLAVLPYAPGDARVLCDILRADLEPAEDDARAVLRRVVDRYLDLGLMPATGFDFQLYLLDRATRAPAFTGTVRCGAAGGSHVSDWRDALLGSLPGLGIDLAGFNSTGTPGQFAVGLDAARGVSAGDAAFGFRTAAGETAARAGLLASFMAKPFIGEPGSGCILRHDLLDAATSRSVFTDADDPLGLSTTAKHFLAGLLYHAEALTALLVSSPNSYKRLGADAGAPVAAGWGVGDRALAFRLPSPTPAREGPLGRLGADRCGVTIESRIGSADLNPYIALAGSLAAGLDGIERRLLPPEPVLTADATPRLPRVPRLPASLDEALDALEADLPLREALGETFVRGYLFVKRFDIASTRLACPDYQSAGWAGRIDPFEWRDAEAVLR